KSGWLRESAPDLFLRKGGLSLGGACRVAGQSKNGLSVHLPPEERSQASCDNAWEQQLVVAAAHVGDHEQAAPIALHNRSEHYDHPQQDEQLGLRDDFRKNVVKSVADCTSIHRADEERRSEQATDRTGAECDRSGHHLQDQQNYK